MTLMVQVVEVFDNAGKPTLGTPQLKDMSAAVADGAGFTAAANIPAVAVPFADLTAAANAHNALLAALKAAGLMIAD